MEKILSRCNMEMHILGLYDVSLFQETTKIISKTEINESDATTFLSEETVVVIIVKINEQLVGMITANVIKRPDDKILMIDNIAVTKKDLDQEIVSQIIECLKIICYKLGFAEMSVSTNASNESAIRLYEETGAMNENDNDPAIIFWYQIK